MGVLVIFGHWERPEIVVRVVDEVLIGWLGLFDDTPENSEKLVTFLLCFSVFILIFVMVKNVWIVRKINEYRKWCKSTRKIRAEFGDVDVILGDVDDSNMESVSVFRDSTMTIDRPIAGTKSIGPSNTRNLRDFY